MERLTYFKDGYWRVNFSGVQYQADFVDRLAAYEDTGLTPERCAEFARADAEGRYIVMRDAEQEGVARPREIAEADKDGRVVVLPCKVGDTVYFALLGRIIEAWNDLLRWNEELVPAATFWIE